MSVGRPVFSGSGFFDKILSFVEVAFDHVTQMSGKS